MLFRSKILTSQITQGRFYSARANGFRSELDFGRVLRKKEYDLLDGGQFLITKKNRHQSLENEIIYVTVSDDDKSRYGEFYRKITHLAEVKNAFFVSFRGVDSWKSKQFTIKNENKKKVDVQIIKPEFTVYKFIDGKWNESGFDEIKNLLIERKTRTANQKPKEFFQYLKNYDLGEKIGRAHV